MKLSLIGGHIYGITGKAWEEMSLKPSEALSSVSGSLGDHYLEMTAKFVIGFSDRQNQWCGISRVWLSREVEHQYSRRDAIMILSAIGQMLRSGLLESISVSNGWFKPSTKVICPTQLLLHEIRVKVGTLGRES